MEILNEKSLVGNWKRGLIIIIISSIIGLVLYAIGVFPTGAKGLSLNKRLILYSIEVASLFVLYFLIIFLVKRSMKFYSTYKKSVARRYFFITLILVFVSILLTITNKYVVRCNLSNSNPSTRCVFFFLIFGLTWFFVLIYLITTLILWILERKQKHK